MMKTNPNVENDPQCSKANVYTQESLSKIIKGLKSKLGADGSHLQA
jgi:predicted secreted Zn-dependent protease